MNALTQRLASRNKQRTTKRLQAQMIEAKSTAQTITATVTGSSAEGLTLRTQSGGFLTVPRSTVQKLPQQPAIGQSQQLSTGGQLRILEPAKSRSTAKTATPSPPVVRYPLRPPTPGQDIGANGDLWLEQTALQGSYNEANGYVWVQKLGQWIKLAGGDGLTVEFGFGPPPDPSDPSFVAPADGQPYHDRLVNRLWHWFERDAVWLPTGSRSFFQGVPSINPRSYVTGDRVTILISSGSTLSPCDYLWSEDLSDWVLVSCCPNCPDTFSNTNCGHDQAYNGNTCSALPD